MTTGNQAYPRLYPSSWAVCASAVAIFALIAVPGMIQVPYLGWYPRYSHGWPAEYLVREVDDAPVQASSDGEFLLVVGDAALLSAPETAPWLSIDSWRLWHADASEWQWLNLAIDLLVGTAIVGIVTTVWEWRRRGRGRVLQISLAEMAIYAAMVAIVLGYWTCQAREAAHDQRIAESLDLRGLYFEQGIVAPVWLQRLVGLDNLSFCSTRVIEITLSPEDLDRIEELVQSLAQLKQLHTVYFLSPEGRELNMTFSELSRLASLRVVDLSSVNRSDLLFNENDINGLARLTQLREVRFYAEDEPKPELLAAIRERLPRCRITFESK
jgi:hypothetical protein